MKTARLSSKRRSEGFADGEFADQVFPSPHADGSRWHQTLPPHLPLRSTCLHRNPRAGTQPRGRVPLSPLLSSPPLPLPPRSLHTFLASSTPPPLTSSLRPQQTEKEKLRKFIQTFDFFTCIIPILCPLLPHFLLYSSSFIPPFSVDCK